MATMNNAKRGFAAKMAVQAHAKAKGERYDESGENEHVVDLITDLMHLCEQKGMSFSHLAGSAGNHYEAERTEAA